MITIDWQDHNRLFDQVYRALREEGIRLGRVPERAIQRGAMELQARVQRLAPKKTSTLVRSITTRIERVRDGVILARVGTHMHYAPYVEHGTGIHGPKHQAIEIVARKAKGLFWGAYNADGRPIIRRRVRIAGMKPRRPFGRAIADFLPRYREIIRQELEKAAQA